MKAVLIYSQFLAVFTAITVHSYEYCKYEKKLCDTPTTSPPKHIACNPDQLTDVEVTDYDLVPMTSKLREDIVNAHNTYRNEIACGKIKDVNNESFPQASKMQQVEWDYELEYVSRCHALRCTFKHDKCRNTHRFPVSGQNLAILTMSDKAKPKIVDNIKKLIKMWYEEYKVGLVDNIRGKITDEQKEKGIVVGHFTVLVNEKVDKIGCSYNICYKTKSHKVRHLLTCNYSYTNMRGSSSYTSGSATSECGDFKKSASSKYECLCE